ncbi:MAG: hypothetical protein DMF19_13710, partial [Verrucomicrobia bacterium]
DFAALRSWASARKVGFHSQELVTPMATMRKKKMDRVISLQDWTAGEYINLPGCFGALFDVLAVQIFLRKTEGSPD